MQLAVAAAKLLILEEEGVVHEGEGVEDVELGLFGEDEGVVHEGVEALLERLLVDGRGEARFRGVVEEVGDAQDVLDLDDGGFDAEKGEEVGNVVVFVLIRQHIQYYLPHGVRGRTSTTYDQMTWRAPLSVLGRNQ